jgi:predicted ATPase
MLTRIEIDGFKSFDEFALDVPPFLAIVGPNTAGKSNLFDALQLLSHLADKDLRSAFSALRGRPFELFRRRGDGTTVDTMTLAAEVLLAPDVTDPWGSVVPTTKTRLRYEVTIVSRESAPGVSRPFVAREAAYQIKGSEDRWIRLTHPSDQFVRQFVRRGGRGQLLSGSSLLCRHLT